MVGQLSLLLQNNEVICQIKNVLWDKVLNLDTLKIHIPLYLRFNSEQIPATSGNHHWQFCFGSSLFDYKCHRKSFGTLPRFRKFYTPLRDSSWRNLNPTELSGYIGSPDQIKPPNRNMTGWRFGPRQRSRLEISAAYQLKPVAVPDFQPTIPPKSGAVTIGSKDHKECGGGFLTNCP